MASIDCRKSKIWAQSSPEQHSLEFPRVQSLRMESLLEYINLISIDTPWSLQLSYPKVNLIWACSANKSIEGYKTRWFVCRPGSMINSRHLIDSDVLNDQHRNRLLLPSPDLLLTMYHVISLTCLEGDFWPAQYHATALQWHFVTKKKKSMLYFSSPAT